jgi:uncharacterized membrane protein YebE (DUF533 family)
MFDPKSLLDQFLGAGTSAGGFARDARQKLQSSGLNSFGGGAALGGVLGLLVAQAMAPASLDELSQLPASQLPHALPAADGSPFELLLRAMIGAAKSDGQVDAVEQQHLFEQVEKMGLDPQAKAAVFDLLAKPLDLTSLDALASRLQLPAPLRAHLDSQLAAA